MGFSPRTALYEIDALESSANPVDSFVSSNRNNLSLFVGPEFIPRINSLAVVFSSFAILVVPNPPLRPSRSYPTIVSSTS